MGADIEVGLREEGCQPPPVVRPHCVRIRIDPYNYFETQKLIRSARREFPKWTDKERWNYSVQDNNEPNVWILDFNFRDIEDAIVFGLKYSR
jgi:hypothetical protein